MDKTPSLDRIWTDFEPWLLLGMGLMEAAISGSCNSARIYR